MPSCHRGVFPVASVEVGVGEGVAKPTFSLLIPAAFFSGVLSTSPPALFLLFVFLPFGVLVGQSVGPDVT